MKSRHLVVAFTVLMTMAAGIASAQQSGRGGRGAVIVAPEAAWAFEAAKVVEAAPLEAIAPVKSAPFSAEAVTEFTQVLGDGNRIERRYVSSIARDSRGRTRREEEIAMVGPLAGTGPAPKLVTIVDPEGGMTFTLDEGERVAYTNRMNKTFHLAHAGEALRARAEALKLTKKNEALHIIGADAPSSKVVTETLAPRAIEGVPATGTRTTTTIPAGAIGNLMPIEIVAERWFSEELQVPLLITRRDPRAGDIVYRLTNITRADPPDHLFTVPPGYEVRQGQLTAYAIKGRATFGIQGTEQQKK